MKFLLSTAALCAGLLGSAASAGVVDVTDTVNATTDADNYWITNTWAPYRHPSYRGADQDWGWAHNAVDGVISSLELNISAWDVDSSRGEVDKIYALDDGVMTLIGTLEGSNRTLSTTTFVLGSNFYNDAANGLQIFLNIDESNVGWMVSLYDSVLTAKTEIAPNPLPASALLMMSGAALFAGVRRSKR